MRTTFLFLILSCLFACNNDLSNDTNQNLQFRDGNSEDYSEVRPEYFDFIGSAHNDGLDYVFENAIRANNQLSYADIKNASLRFFEREYELTRSFAPIDLNASHDDIVSKSVKINTLMIDEVVKSQNLNSEEVAFISQLDQIVGERASVSEKIKAIDDLNNEISKSTLNDVQLARLYMTNSVAKSSLQYWFSDKADKWESVFPIGGEPNPNIPTYPITTLSEIDWANVVKADIAAFILAFPVGVKAGALKGAIVLGLASGGTGALPGAIVGAIGGGCASGITAAVAASGAALAAEAIYSLF